MCVARRSNVTVAARLPRPEGPVFVGKIIGPGGCCKPKTSYRLEITPGIPTKLKARCRGSQIIADFNQVEVRVPDVNRTHFAQGAVARHRPKFDGVVTNV